MAVSVGRSRLPELLTKRGLSQTKFAELLGVSDAFVSQVISGKRYFSYPLAIKAADILKCKSDDLHVIIKTR